MLQDSGELYFLRWEYMTLKSQLYIKASGVVLRGEGMSDIGTILIGKVQKRGRASSKSGTGKYQMAHQG